MEVKENVALNHGYGILIMSPKGVVHLAYGSYKNFQIEQKCTSPCVRILQNLHYTGAIHYFPSLIPKRVQWSNWYGYGETSQV
jgi:hypothetical protein